MRLAALCLAALAAADAKESRRNAAQALEKIEAEAAAAKEAAAKKLASRQAAVEREIRRQEELERQKSDGSWSKLWARSDKQAPPSSSSANPFHRRTVVPEGGSKRKAADALRR